MRILLVQPAFPVPPKSKNHSSCFPIGLLKIGAYHLAQGDEVVLHRGLYPCSRFTWPDEIKITSLFTYWSSYVHEAADYYHSLYPGASIEVGGIYATLMPKQCRRKLPYANVLPGAYRGGVADTYLPAYELLTEDVDFQVLHASRGCPRKCKYCAVWRIEPKIWNAESISDRILRRKLVFYDNNLLLNPHVEDILKELAEYRDKKGRRVWCECQSGLDRRVLVKKPRLATLLREARFHNPRVAWDGPYSDLIAVRKAIRILKKAGYPKNEIYVFMLYNYNISYKEMCEKLDACRRWGVRVVDCRFRPLDKAEDGYKSYKKSQERGEYHIHEDWTDKQVRAFRRKVRRQNIAIMLGLSNNRYVEGCERGYIADASGG